MREVMLCSLLSISNRSLLEDTNAISIPEKNAEKAEVLCLRSIVPLDDPSDNFSLIGDVFRSIVYFASMHEYPEKICIVCDSEETEELYEEVYDFWFPEE